MKSGRTLLLLVLPIWRGGHHKEKSTFESAVLKLIEFVSENRPKSIAMDEIGVRRFGFPRQVIL
jgi:O-acetyl-ADP-ribose deacetylase (regulator of RNase III)